MSRCIATDNLAGLHEYEPGSRKEHDRLYFEGYQLCGNRRGHRLHKGACAEECGRPAAGGSEYCCKRCADTGGHTAKCDEREESES